MRVVPSARCLITWAGCTTAHMLSSCSLHAYLQVTGNRQLLQSTMSDIALLHGVSTAPMFAAPGRACAALNAQLLEHMRQEEAACMYCAGAVCMHPSSQQITAGVNNG